MNLEHLGEPFLIFHFCYIYVVCFRTMVVLRFVRLCSFSYFDECNNIFVVFILAMLDTGRVILEHGQVILDRWGIILEPFPRSIEWSIAL